MLGHKKLENTDIYTHLVNFEVTARNLEEEKKLIEAGFKFVRAVKRRIGYISEEKVEYLSGPVV